ncbi:MAG: 3-dehydroquinate synthase [Hyphomicrobiaceae bacterium]|nr:3-dehydroquinate synthase [Hyphomicrobiaceae bacterium]
MIASGSTAEPVKVGVALGSRSYEVLIGPGLLRDAPRLVAQKVGDGRIGIVTDSAVAKLHLARLEDAFKAGGRHAGTCVVPAGESSKSFAELARVCEALISMGLERRDVVLALGGGVIGDLAGFAASIIRRGIRFVQVPTTLLAQVDSSVGGKTGINTPQGKNLVGSFHQPSLVLADLDVLGTLPERQFRAGYAEAAKFGLLGDAAYFDWLERSHNAVFAREPAALGEAIRIAVAGKAGIVERDETETGERMLLNLGHTFGHALEAWAGFCDRLLHGEAVAIGIAQAFRFSAELGLVAGADAARVEAHLRSVGLPTRIAHIAGADRPTPELLVRIMGQDKKNSGGRITLILVRGIGQAFATREVEADAVARFLGREIALGSA